VRTAGLRYLDCGDWVESRTALVEDASGEIRVARWHTSGEPASESSSPAEALESIAA
jgi:hypothetical protein